MGDRVTAISLRPSLDIEKILEENELSGSATNVAFLIDQIEEFKMLASNNQQVMEQKQRESANT